VPGRRRKVYIITGPTAVGKSAAAFALANAFGAEIISADSRQVYIGMDIGTAKPTASERRMVRHHLLDIIGPEEEFNAALFKEKVLEAIEEVHRRDKIVIIVGGTGLYIRALLEGLTFQGIGRDEEIRAGIESEIESEGIEAVYAKLKELDPEACEKIHPNNIPRVVRALEVIRLTGRLFSEVTPSGKEGPAHEYVAVCMNIERDALYRRIDRRVEEMIHAGWPEEVKGLMAEGYSPELRALNAIGYREIVDYVEGRIALREAVDAIQKATRNFAQRQLTFFRGMTGLKWVELDPSLELDEVVSMLADELGFS